jgi:Ca-activated chloride channel family protein
MSGAKIDAAKLAVHDAVNRLQDGDIFTLVTFATDVRCPLSAKRVDGSLRRVIRSSLEEIRAGGQTALCGGLELGVAQALEARQETNLVLVLSDGQANVGETDVEAIGRRAMDARDKGITVSSLGVGQDYNEALMAEIAIDGGGRFYHLVNASQIAAYLTGELGEMASLAARNATLDLDLPSGVTVGVLSAAYPVRGNQVTLGDIPSGTRLEVVLCLHVPPQEAGTRLPVAGTLHYRSPAGSALSTALNQVVVRYDLEKPFVVTAGVVRPTARRVLAHMQSAGILATSKAATLGVSFRRQEGDAALSAMRKYARILGEDEAKESILAEGAQVMSFMSGGTRVDQAKVKAATHAAMRRHRGSKDFES